MTGEKRFDSPWIFERCKGEGSQMALETVGYEVAFKAGVTVEVEV